jgi:hypothetical protein
VVKHLIDNRDRVLPGADAPFPCERDIDRIAPADLILPLPADSSQIAACVAAAQGRDFTVIGPPGSGKSQAIANLIATLLGNGQRALFRRQKTAASRRWLSGTRRENLADHCLELHSNKADRRHVLSQLKKSWETGSTANQGDWIAINDRLQIRRDQLNLYVEALHTPQANGWSAFRATSIAAPQMERHALALAFSAFNVHDRETSQLPENLAGQLGLTFGAVKIKPALCLFHVEEWTSVWQEHLFSAARTAARYAGLARALECSDRSPVLWRHIHAASWPESRLTTSIASGARALLQSGQCHGLAKRKIRKLLSNYTGSGSVDPGIDIGLIRRVQETAQAVFFRIAGSERLASPVAGLDTDTTSINGILSSQRPTAGGATPPSIQCIMFI